MPNSFLKGCRIGSGPPSSLSLADGTTTSTVTMATNNKPITTASANATSAVTAATSSSAYLGGFDGNFMWNRRGAEYPGSVCVWALRLLPALCGALCVPLAYLLQVELGGLQYAALGAALLVLMENSLIVQSRFMLLESVLISFQLLSFCYWRFHNTPNRGSRYLWLIVAAVSCAGAVEVKYVGVSTYLLLLGIASVHTWQLIGQQAVSHRKMLTVKQEESEHKHSSSPLEWISMTTNIVYWLHPSTNAQILLIGNVVSWGMANVSLAAYQLLAFWYLLRRRRSIRDIPEDAWCQFQQVGVVCVGGWLVNFLPFFLMETNLFLYHYLPAYTFLLQLLPAVLEHTHSPAQWDVSVAGWVCLR
ncbi:hypothetical protein NHX12_029109 [Muraenolepis orangiensis]|uniref:ArnT-like N-terminal domain-containing protein n=1 Tax=Muraenolepis orangiensis TaxID=630683 RepID=A0A9Q0EF01_9TELE|nr:hypothetical protein NHX12_029109 [Muraenolepis orangiensis]